MRSENPQTLHHLRLVRLASEHEEAALALHCKAMKPFARWFAEEDEEADLRDVPQAYLKHWEFLIGTLGERIVAMGGFKRDSATTAELKRIRIDPTEQGKGYGSRLLRALERRAIALGMSILHLETAKARGLTLASYDKHGYEQTGKDFYGAVEAVNYSKKLTPAKPDRGSTDVAVLAKNLQPESVCDHSADLHFAVIPSSDAVTPDADHLENVAPHYT